MAPEEKENKTQNDKRFFDSGNDDDEQSKEKEEQKKRPPIQLPDLSEINSKKESREAETKKEGKKSENMEAQNAEDANKEEKTTPQPFKMFRTEKPAMGNKASAKTFGAKNKWLLAGIYSLTVLLLGAGFLVILLIHNRAGLKEKMKFNTKLVQETIKTKEEMLRAKRTLQDEIDKLKIELIVSTSASKDLEKQYERLQQKLSSSQEKFSQLNDEIKKYAEGVRNLAERRIEYYDAYKLEKQSAKKYAVEVETLKNKIDELQSKVDSIEKQRNEKLAQQIHEQAFVYLKANMYDKTIENFKKYLELHGEDANIHYNLGFLYDVIKKDRDKAIKHYERYLALNPNAKDLYEIKMRIASLKRLGKESENTTLKNFKVNLDELKY